jgi:hypothetical protein
MAGATELRDRERNNATTQQQSPSHLAVLKTPCGVPGPSSLARAILASLLLSHSAGEEERNAKRLSEGRGAFTLGDRAFIGDANA